MEVLSSQSTSQEDQRDNKNNTNVSKNIKNNSNMKDPEEDEEDICRICRNPGDSGNPLRYPCACKGTMKFVHQDCLLRWLNLKNARHCEVCRHAFSFSPVYAENAPTRLHFVELAIGIAAKAGHVIWLSVPLGFVLLLLFLIVPLVTIWTWRLSFVKSPGDVERLFLSHISATSILKDCFFGFLLNAGTGCIAILATSLWYYLSHLLKLERAPAPANGIPAVEGIGEDAGQRNAENVVPRLQMLAEIFVENFVRMYDGRNPDVAEVVRFILAFLGMQGTLFPVIKKALIGLAVTIIYLGGLFFVPFSFGRIILHYISWSFCTATSSMLSKFMQFTDANTTGLEEAFTPLPLDLSSTLSDATILATGYMFIVSLVVLYLSVVALIRNIRGDALIIRRLLAAMWNFVTMMKVPFLHEIVFGVFPLLCGWWLDVCMIGMLGKTITQRVEFFLNSLLASYLIHWIVGVIYVSQLSFFTNLLQEVLRNGVLYFRRNIADPNYVRFRAIIDQPVHKFALKFLRLMASTGLLTVFLVFLPVKLAMRLTPSIFPLDISLSDPFTEIPTAMLLLWICLPFATEHFRLRATIKDLLRQWFTSVGWALGLTDFLLPRTKIVGQENMAVDMRQDRQLDVQGGGNPPIALIAAGDPTKNIHTSGNFDVVEDYDGHQTDNIYDFVFRIALLLVLTWMALLLFNSALIIVPISLGRALFNSIPTPPITPGIKFNDIYAFIIGSYTILNLLSGVRYFIEHFKTGRSQRLEFSQILKWIGIVIKSSALLPIWILVIPVLIGVLFELLIIVPMRVPVDESPVFFLYQDWALGLFFLYFWTKLVMLDPGLAMVDESWRIKFQRVSQDGFFSQLQALWVLKEILIPIIIKLLTVLCVPYVFARGMFLVLGYQLVVNSSVYRFVWVGCLTVTSLCSCAKRFQVLFTNLHNSVRDDLYMIGPQLHNFGEVGFARRNDSADETIPDAVA